MESKNIASNQPFAAAQSSAADPASCPTTPNNSRHLKSTGPVNEHGSALQDASRNLEPNDSVGDGGVAGVNHEKLERLEHRISKRMYADRDNRLLDIFLSRMRNKIQWDSSREARRRAKHRRLSRDEKQRMD
ncbi:hypothetical protein LX36DRAFT_712124 [Colletotrichum falcatum]|nr:hypothetical protein LX36DRAFT_712124 [Colletotrichum falcatum]